MNRAAPYVQIAIGIIIAILGWSLRQNVVTFGEQLASVAADVRTVAIQAAANDRQTAVLETRVVELARRVDGIEMRERQQK
jgi:predicted permease